MEPDREGAQISALLDNNGAVSAHARHLAANFLAGQVTRVSDRVVGIAQLVVSELVTNARKFAVGPVRLDLRMHHHAGELEIAVWDSDPTVPTPQPSDPNRVGQHGLEIVKALTSSLHTLTGRDGKRITARIPLADAP